MNREFKFRLWSKSENCFVNPNILEVWDESGKMTPFQFVKTGKLDPIYMPIENYVIQQYTGLNDKNNNPIYEGDIVKTIYDNIGIILYHEQTGSYRIQIKNQLLPIVTYRFVENVPQGLLLVVHEVIGNVFENSDLINT